MTSRTNKTGLGRFAAKLAGFCAGLLLAGQASAYYVVTIDTSAWQTTDAILHFSFLSNSTSNGLFNTAAVDGFSTDGIKTAEYGDAFPIGGVTGDLSGRVNFTGSQLGTMNYWADITLGSFITFTLYSSNNGPDLGFDPDMFEFSLDDPGFGTPLAASSDPTGRDQLGRLSLLSVTQFDAYQAGGFGVTGTAIPEPATLALLGIAAISLIGMRRRQRA